MLLRKLFFLFLILGIASSFAHAVTTFPYTNLIISYPGQDTPYPGLGNDYCSLGSGIRTARWNPAGLAKIRGAEGYLGASVTALSTNTGKEYEVTDLDVSISGASGTSATNYTNKLLLTSDPTATVATTREFTDSTVYSPQSSGMDFMQAVKVSDWLSLGISTRGGANMSFALSGTQPSQYYSRLDLTNTTNFLGTGISVNSAGKITYTFTPAGFSSYTYTSEASVWSGFLRQTARVPFTTIIESRDSIDYQNNYTLTGAGKWGNLSYGVNFTPISSTINIDNTAKAIVDAGTADPYFYAPNFNPSNEAEVLQWIRDPNQYGTEAGYKKNYLRVPAGASIAEAKYNGYYAASAVKTDFGVMYDLGEHVTLGLALENLGGAALNYKGVGRVAYVNTRVNTTETVSIIDPSKSTNWSPFQDTFDPMSGTEGIGMLPQINVNIPQRTKLGITIRKPILFTFDYERQVNPLTVRYKDKNGNYSDAVFSNLTVLRAGAESQFFFLPLLVRGHVAALWKPEATGLEGLDPTSLNTYNSVFLLKRLMPLAGGIGFYTMPSIWNLGFSVGSEGVPLLNSLHLDVANLNLTRLLYYNVSLDKDNWHVLWQSNMDPGATAAAYNNLTDAEKNRLKADSSGYLNIIRWISTLTVGFSF